MTNQKAPKELVINPTVKVVAGFNLRTQNDGFKHCWFSPKDEPELSTLLINLASHGWSSERIQEVPSHLLERLVDMGVIVPKDEIPDKVCFHCSLDRLPFEFAPNKFGQLKYADKDFGEFVVSRGTHLQIGPEPPVNLEHRIPFRDKLQQADSIIWVEDAGTNVFAPYWMKAEFVEMIQRLVDGRISPSDLPPHVAEILAYINVLIPKGHEEARVIEWQGICGNLSAQLESEQYVVIRNIIHPLQLAALRCYFRKLDQKGYLQRDEYQCKNRYVDHDEEVARYIHYQITNLVSRIVPQPIKPSYAFLTTYKSGSILEKHKDREQCAWNLSLLIDMNPEVELSNSWPIYFEVEGQVREVRLNMGDGVLYRGTDIPHWRDIIPEGHIVTLILCHFVPADFLGILA